MGQGGRVELVNNTSERWVRVHQHAYQMDSWDFPETVDPGQKASCYVEWERGFTVHEHDDAGEARYRSDRSGYEFEVQARHIAEKMISVRNISVPGQWWGYRDDVEWLGWEHDGTVSFTLPGSG